MRAPEIREKIINVHDGGKRVISENVIMGTSHEAQRGEWDPSRPVYTDK